MEVSGQLHASATLPPGKELQDRAFRTIKGSKKLRYKYKNWKITEFTGQCRRNWKEQVDRMGSGGNPKRILISTKRKKKFLKKTSEDMRELCFVIGPVRTRSQ
jgi:hypothetical protein